MYTLQQISELFNSEQGSGFCKETQVATLTCDSREVETGAVFVAVKGHETDGHAYIESALAKGAAVVIYQLDCYDIATLSSLENIVFIGVEDSRDALATLASFWYGNPAQDMVVIGVTGTNGKTTVTWLLEEMLVNAGFITGVMGTVNYRYRKGKTTEIIEQAALTTPDALKLQKNLKLMRDEGVSHVIMEVASHGLHQKRVGAIEFDIAVFTNLSRDHLDYHSDLEEYFVVKQQLFTRYLKGDGTAVIVTELTETSDKNWGRELAQMLVGGNVLTCGFDSDNNLQADNVKQNVTGTYFQLRINEETRALSSFLTGRFNVLNILAAAGVGSALDLSLVDICNGLSSLQNVPGRMEKVLLVGDESLTYPAVFVDYAHTPDAIENALKTLRQVCKGKLICVFGCGGDRDRGKRPEMGSIAGRYADIAIVTSDNPRSEDPAVIIRDILPGLEQNSVVSVGVGDAFHSSFSKVYSVIIDRSQAIAQACLNAAENDCVLIAGKGHEQYQLFADKTCFFDDSAEAFDALVRWDKQKLINACNGKIVSLGEVDFFNSVVTDSRIIGLDDIFVALKGEKFDGHDHVKSAVSKGAAAVIVEQRIDALPGVLTIEVDDTLAALGALAKYRRSLFGSRLNVVGITGSSGKTTVKEMTASIFSCWHDDSAYDENVEFTLKTKGNFNNLIGLPLSLLPVSAVHKTVILEMGMNCTGEIEKLTHISEPDIGCITNIQPAHLLGLGSVKGVAAAKGELFKNMTDGGIRVVNCDDPNVRKIGYASKGPKIGFAITPAGRKCKPVVKVTRISNLGENGTRFTLHVKSEKMRLSLLVPGNHNVSNAAAAAAIATAAGVSLNIIKTGLEKYRAFDKRMDLKTLPGGIRIINDAYNANPSSMTAALETLSTFGQHCKRIAVLGDMLELGNSAEEQHVKIGKVAANLKISALAVTGNHSAAIAKGAISSGLAEGDVNIFSDNQAIATWLYHLVINGALTSRDWVLIKGSRGMRMETVIEKLEELLTP